MSDERKLVKELFLSFKDLCYKHELDPVFVSQVYTSWSKDIQISYSKKGRIVRQVNVRFIKVLEKLQAQKKGDQQ